MNRIYGGLKSRPYNLRELVVKEGVTYTFSGVPVTSVASGASVQIIQYTPPVDLKSDEFAFSSDTAYSEDSGLFESAPVLTNTYNLPVTYSSSDTNVATVDENGTVSIESHGNVFTGNTVITASFAGNEKYNAKEVSYTLTVDIPQYFPEQPLPEPENTEEPGE